MLWGLWITEHRLPVTLGHIFIPGRIIRMDENARQCSSGTPGFRVKRPAQFLNSAIRFFSIAGSTRSANVLPCVGAPLGGRNDVVYGCGAALT